MFKMAFKFLPMEVEGERRTLPSLWLPTPGRRGGRLPCSLWNVLFNQGPSLEWFGNNKLRLTVDKNEEG